MLKKASLIPALFLLLSCLVASVIPLRSVWAADVPAISAVQSLSETGGVPASGNGVHGGQQTRILRTSHGTYAAYVSAQFGGSPGLNEFTLLKLEGTVTKVLYQDFLPLDSSSVNIMCDANEEVYVAAIPDNKFGGSDMEATAHLTIYHLDSKTNMVTGYNAILPFKKPIKGGYGYSMPIMDAAQGKIYALFSGGDHPEGAFAWFIFDLKTREWDPEVRMLPIESRHCYNYAYPDGKGGIVLVSERDVLAASIGHAEIPASVNSADYVWDKLTLFVIPDMTQAVCEKTVVIASPDPFYADVGTDGLPKWYPNISNNDSGDVFLDRNGLLHVLYKERLYKLGTPEEPDNYHSAKNTQTYQAIYRGSELLYQGPISYGKNHNDYSVRMAQATDGILYIIALPKAEGDTSIEIWRAADAEGRQFTLAAEKALPGLRSPISVNVSGPRNGSLADNVVDCMFSDASDNFQYFQVTLPVSRTKPGITDTPPSISRPKDSANAELGKVVAQLPAKDQSGIWNKHEKGQWTLTGPDGKQLTGWRKVDGDWYLLDSNNGVMKTGWNQVNKKWYLLGNSGAMKIGWVRENGKWYLLDGSGAMKIGWARENGKWYLLDGSGAMKTGWARENGKWYLLDGSGAMKTGWAQDNGKWYYLSSSGRLLAGGLTPDGYRVDSNGEWIR